MADSTIGRSGYTTSLEEAITPPHSLLIQAIISARATLARVRVMSAQTYGSRPGNSGVVDSDFAAHAGLRD